MIPSDARLLRLHVRASQTHASKPLYRVIVEEARALGLAGASVFPAELAIGRHGRIHDARSEYTSYDMPVDIEIVDGPQRIEILLGRLRPMGIDIFGTIEPVRVLHYAPHRSRTDETGAESAP